MNPWDLSAADLLVWGIVLHLVADWPLQNDWMANHKARRRELHAERFGGMGKFGYASVWWDRHPAAYVHAGIHGLLLGLVFGWVAAPLALAHLVIDCRWPVARWSKLIRQTQPAGRSAIESPTRLVVTRWDQMERDAVNFKFEDEKAVPVYDIGLEVRFWTDQVFHIACIAVAALAVSA